MPMPVSLMYELFLVHGTVGQCLVKLERLDVTKEITYIMSLIIVWMTHEGIERSGWTSNPERNVHTYIYPHGRSGAALAI